MRARPRVERVLTQRRCRVLGQPIVDLTDGARVGVEALARPYVPPTAPPDARVDEAQTVEPRRSLRLAAVESALELLDHLDAPTFLAISLAPQTIASDALQELLDARACDRIVVELTEHVSDGSLQLRGALRRLRQQGVRLAVNVPGADFPSLGHILGHLVQLAPDLIALDRQLTRRVSRDPVLRAQAAGLVTFARAADATVIAKGVDTADQLETVHELGIRLAQGAIIAPPALLSWPPKTQDRR